MDENSGINRDRSFHEFIILLRFFSSIGAKVNKRAQDRKLGANFSIRAGHSAGDKNPCPHPDLVGTSVPSVLVRYGCICSFGTMQSPINNYDRTLALFVKSYVDAKVTLDR